MNEQRVNDTIAAIKDLPDSDNAITVWNIAEELYTRRPPIYPQSLKVLVDETRGVSGDKGREIPDCRSNNDGECDWEDCPQIKDGEPEKTGRSCPLYDWDDDERF